MDKQEIFDKAYLGLKAQGFVQSMKRDDEFGPTCAYRGSDGLKCAIGHLIPDELYQPRWDNQGTGVNYLPTDLFTKLGIEYSFGMNMFLDELQGVHDNYNTPEGMQVALANFAKSWKVKVPK